MEHQKQKKDGATQEVARADGCFLAMHLDRALPVLQVKPWAHQQTDNQRYRITH